MNTEDDTFRILRRMSIGDAMKVYHQNWNAGKNILHKELEKTGWTLVDLQKHFRKESRNDYADD